jgi:heme o synthase
VALSLVIVLSGALGRLYLVGAALLGAGFVGLAIINLRARRQRWSRWLFDYSIAYLALLFGVMVADRMVG